MATTNHVRRAALAALLVSIALLAAKFTAYFLTGSKAVLSDAIESVINVITGGFMLVSVTIGSRPADECHPYGHGKVESFSAGLEGGLILLAGLVILTESVPAFFRPQPPQQLDIGILLLLAAGIVNLGMGGYLLRLGRHRKSDALIADGHHLLTDFYTSAGVILGLTAVHFTGQIWLDPLVACLVAINILVPGIRLLRQSIRNLMDEADPELLSRIVTALQQIENHGWLCPHQLRVIRSGNYHHIDLHITLPHYCSLQKSHAIEKEVARTLLEALGEEGDVMIHLDPCEPPCCSCCEIDPCPARSHSFVASQAWTIETVTAAHPACPGRRRRHPEELPRGEQPGQASAAD